jgi:hypothetical protein
MKRLRSTALLIAAAALLAVPAIGQANHQPNHNPGAKAKGKGKGKAKSRCVVNKGFVVRGTLASLATYVADNPATPINEANIPVNVTGANRHARRAGVEVGETYTADGTPTTPATVDNDDPFSVQLSGYEVGLTPPDGPSVGDRVRIIGKVAVTKRKCEPNASLAERYDAVNVRKVKIVDAD